MSDDLSVDLSDGDLPDGDLPDGDLPDGDLPTTGGDPDASRNSVDDARAGAEPVEDLTCSSPSGPLRCIDSVAAFPIGADDQVMVAGSGVVVGSPAGRVRTHELGSGRQRWETTFGEAVVLHPSVARTTPIGVPGRTRFLTLDTGFEVGSFDGSVVASVATGPWLVVRDDQGTIAARSVTGSTTWERELPVGGRAWLTPEGVYLDDQAGTLTSLFTNTGADRWAAPLDGTIRSVHRTEDRTVIVVEDPPGVVTLDGRGDPVSTVEFDGALRWFGLDPDGTRALVVTEVADGGTELSIVTLAGRGRRAVVPLAGPLGDVDPIVGKHVIVVPISGASPQLDVIDLGDDRLRHRLSVREPVAGVALTASDGLAVLERDGTLVMRSLATAAERYRVAFGDDAELLRAQPLLIRSPIGVTALDPAAGT